jgi:putative endonuclease
MKKIIGNWAEQTVRKYLEQQGLTWVCSNYLCPQGEIDLIMRDSSYLVFVEVRYRSDPNYGESVETVVWRKQSRLIKAAWHYLLETHAVDKEDSRFDVVGVTADEKIYWIQNAFEVKY